MNRRELIEAVRAETGLTRKEAEGAVCATLAGIVRGLCRDGSVLLPDFGAFAVKETPARMGRNPRDGSPVEVAAHKRVVFSAYRAAKDAVNSEVKA